MTAVDEYIETVVKIDTAGAELLAALCAPTLRNSSYIDRISSGTGGISVLRIQEGYNVVAHTAAGAFDKLDPAEHTASLVDRLYRDAEAIGVTPVALVDTVDASDGRREVIQKIGDALVSKANEKKVAIINGEVAVLGYRVNCDANVSGTMISIAGKSFTPGIHEMNGVKYVVFDPEGRAVHGNSDGVGTWTEFSERSGRYERALKNSLAMKLDDSSKNGARAMAVFDVVERSGEIPIETLEQEARRLGAEMGFEYVLVHENAGNRLHGWKKGEPVYNVSGSAITTIDEKYLTNPLAPGEGDHVLAIRGSPNPRSNGITDKRMAMIRTFGKDWHLHPVGRIFMEFLNEPAIVFYPLFNALIDENLTTSVTHMSGGALKSKLAKPLAKKGLYAALEGLYPADWRELALGGFGFTSAENAYTKWPMGNDGYITTRKPGEAIDLIRNYELEAKIVGQVEKAKEGRTGVELLGIKGSDGKDVYFSGQ